METELEAKFLLAGEEISSVLERIRGLSFAVEEGKAVEVSDRYFDTPQWKILRRGWAYRWRQYGAKRFLTLKSAAPSEGTVHRRQELEFRVDEFPESEAKLPREFGAELDGVSWEELRGLFALRNRRQLWKLKADGAVLELAYDRVEIFAEGSQAMVFCELEIELKQGSEACVLALSEDLADHPELRPSLQSKFERGIEVAGWSFEEVFGA